MKKCHLSPLKKLIFCHKIWSNYRRNVVRFSASIESQVDRCSWPRPIKEKVAARKCKEKLQPGTKDELGGEGGGGHQHGRDVHWDTSIAIF